MKILLLGGSGFLGSHLLNKLDELGHEVLAPTSGQVDLRRQVQVDSLFSYIKPDWVINAAGKVGGIQDNKNNPGDFFFDNIAIGMNVLHASKIAGVKKYIQIGSTCSYPKLSPAHYHIPMSPSHLWQGYPEETNSAYGIAKRSLIEMAKAYRKQYGFNAITVILANLYGPGCKSSHVIPDLIRKFAEAKARRKDSVTILGSGAPTREFLYVDDAVEAILIAGEKWDEEQPLNVGSGEEVSIAQLAHYLKDLTYFNGSLFFDASLPDGQSNRLLDSSEIREKGWDHKVTLKEGLKLTLEAYQRENACLLDA